MRGKEGSEKGEEKRQDELLVEPFMICKISLTSSCWIYRSVLVLHVVSRICVFVYI